LYPKKRYPDEYLRQGKGSDEDETVNKRQLRKAAQLWSLSTIAHAQMDTGIKEFDELRKVAIDEAWKKLKRMGFDPCCLRFEQECINAVITKMI
jgi:hypothetical protein